MDVTRFGLGVRFDALGTMPDDGVAKQFFEEVFSVLTVTDVKGLHVFGGLCDECRSAGQNIFTIVFMGGSLKDMRNIFNKLDNDAGVNMYLDSSLPYIENNRIEGITGLTYYGKVQGDGRMRGGEAPLFGLVVPKKHGRKRPVGKGIKIMLAPDSFKGNLSSMEIIKRLTVAARRNFPGVKVVPVPIADGGEGTVEALVTACSGTYRRIEATSPNNEKITAAYGVLHGKTAVIEMAQASGLSVSAGRLNPMKATSFGTGELIKRALDEGIKNLIIGLGGSATNDGGMGCARALGVRFLDAEGRELLGAGEDLAKVAEIDMRSVHPRAKDARFTVMCDVDNPLTGEKGATYVYGPQKGADDEQLRLLEGGMCSYGRLLNNLANRDVSSAAGAGAAGGMGAMLMALFNAGLTPGIDAMLEAIDFETLLNRVSLVITGEGMLDCQTARHGKAVAGIMKRCAKRKIPVAIITGAMGRGAEEIYNLGNAGIMTLINAPMSTEQAMEKGTELFDDAADRMFRFIRMGRDVEKLGAPKRPKRSAIF